MYLDQLLDERFEKFQIVVAGWELVGFIKEGEIWVEIRVRLLCAVWTGIAREAGMSADESMGLRQPHPVQYQVLDSLCSEPSPSGN